MKAVHIVRQFHPSVGGLEDSVLNLGTGLRDLGCDVRIVTLDRLFNQPDAVLASTDEVAGLPIQRIPFKGSRRYPIAPSVLSHIKDADLVHVHAIDFFFDYMAWTKPLHRKPLVASTHGGFFHTEFAARAKKIYFDTVTRGSALAYRKLICGSENDAVTFRRIAPKKVEMIEIGVNIAKLADTAAPAPTKTLIYFGRLSSNKRVSSLFPLLARLRAQDPEWRLILAGGVWDISLEQLKTQMDAVRVTEFVRHVDRPSDEQLRALIGEASYYISASSYEGFGLTAVEAMSAGLVPVLSDIPTFRALIERTGEGLLIDPENPDKSALSIAEYSRRFATDAEQIRRHLKTTAKGYAWPAVARRYYDEYLKIVGQDS